MKKWEYVPEVIGTANSYALSPEFLRSIAMGPKIEPVAPLDIRPSPLYSQLLAPVSPLGSNGAGKSLGNATTRFVIVVPGVANVMVNWYVTMFPMRTQL